MFADGIITASMIRQYERALLWLFTLLLCSLGLQAQYPGPDGSATGPLPNHSVPCRHFNGTWHDNFGTGNTYYITSSLINNSISGTANIQHAGGPSCPRVTFQLSGSIAPTGGTPPFIRGTTTYTLQLTNPNQGWCNNGLPIPVNLTGDIRNDGCDIAFGPWNNVGAPGSGTLSLAKSADLPAGESTTSVGWSGGWPTVQQWRQVLSGDSNRPFDGRQVTEAPGPQRTDSCFYSGSPAAGIAPFGVTGGWWSVGRYATPPLYWMSNYWVDDYVGFLPEAVNFYRQAGRAPCDASAEQIMKICTNGTGCTNSQQYRSTFIHAGITPTQVYSGRDVQYVYRNWP